MTQSTETETETETIPAQPIFEVMEVYSRTYDQLFDPWSPRALHFMLDICTKCYFEWWQITTINGMIQVKREPHESGVPVTYCLKIQVNGADTNVFPGIQYEQFPTFGMPTEEMILNILASETFLSLYSCVGGHITAIKPQAAIEQEIDALKKQLMDIWQQEQQTYQEEPHL